MRTTVDKAKRRVATSPKLVRAGKPPVARPTTAGNRPAVDVAALVEDERNRWPSVKDRASRGR